MTGTGRHAGTDVVERVRRRLAATGAPATHAAVADMIREETSGLVGDVDMLSLTKLARAEIKGVGPLDPLLREPDVTDILVNGPDQVWVDRGSGLERARVSFEDEASVRRLATRLAASAGRRLDDACPWVDAVLPDGTRVHAVIPPIAPGGTCLSLRVLRVRPFTMRALVDMGTVTAAAAALLDAVVRARLTFLITGGTGTGKTSMLSTLLGRVDPTERLVLIEDVAELRPDHPHVVRLAARTANIEGAGAVGSRELVRQALRMRPDRIVVGEVRGPELADLLIALNTGHDGGAGTVHANGPAELPARLEALGALGGMSADAVHSQLAATVHVVPHLSRDRNGNRVLASVSVLRRSGRRIVPVDAWSRQDGYGPGFDHLRSLITARGVSSLDAGEPRIVSRPPAAWVPPADTLRPVAAPGGGS